MALKTFNVDEEVYKRFSTYCKANGISMSKQVERFMRDELERLTAAKKRSKTRTEENTHSHVPTADDHAMKKFC